MALDPLTGGMSLAETVLKTATSIFDRLVPDKQAAAAAALEMQKAVLDAANAANAGQIEVNKVEAGSSSLFVSGWRPAVGWVCAAAFAWAYLIGPMCYTVISLFKAGWVPPTLDMEAMLTVLFGLLGLGGLRTYEKIQGIEPPSTPVVTTTAQGPMAHEIRKALPINNG